jgi:probable F420-dependent oxidoreductase
MANAHDSGSSRFRFSVVTTGGTASSLRDWPGYARRVEDLGFSVLQVADHYDNGAVCTPRLAAAAMATTTLRVGSYVYNNDFRHPVLLAREAAEIDVLSGGRMELGLGAGWSKDEYDRIGLSFDPGAARAARYEEAVRIIRDLHAGGVVTLQGAYYNVTDCELHVEPVQQPIPLLLGGGGPRMTRFSAMHADTVAFVPRSLPTGGIDPAEFSTEAFDEKIAILDNTARLRPGQPPERAILAFEVHRALDLVPENSWAPREVIARGPYCLVGDTPRLVDAIVERRERWGLTHWTCWEDDIDTFVPIIAALQGT